MQHQQQQAMMQHSLYQQPALLAPTPIEPINLPPGFDPSQCRSVYIGNIHPQVTEALQEVFANSGQLEGCKLIRKDKSSYGFVDYFDHQAGGYPCYCLSQRQASITPGKGQAFDMKHYPVG